MMEMISRRFHLLTFLPGSFEETNGLDREKGVSTKSWGEICWPSGMLERLEPKVFWGVLCRGLVFSSFGPEGCLLEQGRTLGCSPEMIFPLWDIFFSERWAPRHGKVLAFFPSAVLTGSLSCQLCKKPDTGSCLTQDERGRFRQLPRVCLLPTKGSMHT